MSQLPEDVSHLLRRAGFGVGSTETSDFSGLSLSEAVTRLVDYQVLPDDVDDQIGAPDHLAVVSADTFNEDAILVSGTGFSPNENLVDAQQRMVFRMVHSRRPLQEKMTLFWHNHFATGRSKIVEQLSFPGAIRAFAAKPSEDPDGATGQIELFRQHALGNFRDILIAISQDVAMTCWLDGDTNFVGRPQENFARELMELFCLGVDKFEESDVHSAARVFTGWNLDAIREGADDVHYRAFLYRPERHDTGYKQFSFEIYPDGSNTIPAREAEDGLQDGIDLLTALAAHPATGEFISRKLYTFFVNEIDPPNEQLISEMAAVYYASGFEIREVVRTLLSSRHFHDPSNYWKRYSWPAEYVVRLTKEMGHEHFTANLAVLGMMSMGQTLFDPPNVSGWRLGEHWFSTNTVLARMNFAMSLVFHEQSALAAPLGNQTNPEAVLEHVLARLTHKPFSPPAMAALSRYLDEDHEVWTTSADGIRARTAGLAHLVGASGEYQFL